MKRAGPAVSSLSATELGEGEVYRYAELAKAAYLDRSGIEREFGSAVFVRELANSRVQVALINDPSAAIQWITIRGTANPKNVVVDVRVKVVRETRLGVYLHGAAGELVRRELGDSGLAASDLLPALPRAMRDLRRGA